jgi:hypothetical protein
MWLQNPILLPKLVKAYIGTGKKFILVTATAGKIICRYAPAIETIMTSQTLHS